MIKYSILKESKLKDFTRTTLRGAAIGGGIGLVGTYMMGRADRNNIISAANRDINDIDVAIRWTQAEVNLSGGSDKDPMFSKLNSKLKKWKNNKDPQWKRKMISFLRWYPIIFQDKTTMKTSAQLIGGAAGLGAIAGGLFHAY